MTSNGPFEDFLESAPDAASSRPRRLMRRTGRVGAFGGDLLGGDVCAWASTTVVGLSATGDSSDTLTLRLIRRDRHPPDHRYAGRVTALPPVEDVPGPNTWSLAHQVCPCRPTYARGADRVRQGHLLRPPHWTADRDAATRVLPPGRPPRRPIQLPRTAEGCTATLRPLRVRRMALANADGRRLKLSPQSPVAHIRGR